MSDRMKTEHGHNHGEAFMLMTYACKCGHREVIWNSRDGVTPFCMGCPSCGELSLQHINFRGDIYAPDHKTHPGQRFWRDGTPDEAEAIMRRRIERMRDAYPIPPDREAQLIRESCDGTCREFQKGWPNCERTPE